MKKIVIAAMLAITATAFAGEVSVSALRDYNTKTDGFRVGTEVAGLSLTGTHLNKQYNRYAVGKDFSVTKVGPVEISAGVAGAYQDTNHGKSGYGLSAGANATYALNKSVDAVIGVERFVGQTRIKSFDGNTATVGLTAKF
jgi:hypothetical protein